MEKVDVYKSSLENKTRASIYVDKAFLDELKEIAHEERRSLNEQIIVVLNEFAQAYKVRKKERERRKGISICFKCSKCDFKGDVAINLNAPKILIGEKAKMIVGRCPNENCGGDLLVPPGKYEFSEGRFVRTGAFE